MSVTLDPITTVGSIAHAWIARSGPQHERYGDPYDVACVVIRVTDTLARIEVLQSTHDHPQRVLLVLRPALREKGFTHAMWERRKNVLIPLGNTDVP